jgi:Flp pilus assembly protein TadD
MRRQLFERNRLARRLASTASSAILVFGLCSCQTAGMSDITGALGDKTETSSSTADPRHDVEVYGDRFRADPKDVEAALAYAKALRAGGQRDQAVAVMEKASIANPGNRALLAGYGRALADNGDFQQAFDVLSRAHSPDNPDWRILSAQGAVLDQLGRYDEARHYYESALKIVPDEPSVLSNLGLSYVLSKDLPKAEETLRRANSRPDADPRVRINLAFVLGLEGRMTEAESIAKSGLTPEEAAANVTYLRRLLARKDKDGKENARAEAKIPLASAAHDD